MSKYLKIELATTPCSNVSANLLVRILEHGEMSARGNLHPFHFRDVGEEWQECALLNLVQRSTDEKCRVGNFVEDVYD